MRDGENGNGTSDNDKTNDGNNNSDQTAVTCSWLIFDALVLDIGVEFGCLNVGGRRQGFIEDVLWVRKLNGKNLISFKIFWW